MDVKLVVALKNLRLELLQNSKHNSVHSDPLIAPEERVEYLDFAKGDHLCKE